MALRVRKRYKLSLPFNKKSTHRCRFFLFQIIHLFRLLKYYLPVPMTVVGASIPVPRSNAGATAHELASTSASNVFSFENG